MKSSIFGLFSNFNTMKVSIFSFTLILLFVFACSENKDKPIANTNISRVSPLVTKINELADSVKPYQVTLSDQLPPQVIQIPKQAGDFSSYLNDGERVILEPPKVMPLLVLKDENGKEIKNEKGESYILGEGGMAQFTTYTSDDGLALDAVNSSLMDSRGHLWFGTSGGGVSHYDGTGFTNNSTVQGLAANNLRSIIEDKHGNLWFGTVGGGASKFDGRSFTNFITSKGLASDVVYSIHENKDCEIWIGGGGGISLYDGKSFSNYIDEQGLRANDVLAF